MGLVLGSNVGIGHDVFLDPSHCYLISIGDNCTICPSVRLIAHDASTKKILGYTKIGKIDIKNNCFIGDSSLILLNTTVGPNSVVGAGSVVTKDVPPNVIVAGNPARIISPIKDYIDKMGEKAKTNTILSDQYHIDKLNNDKINEILIRTKNGIGFII